MKFEKITPRACKVLRDEMNAALVELAKGRGVTVKVGSARYTDDDVTFKVTVALDGFDRDKHDFENCCFVFGLKKSDHGRMFNYAGFDYTLQKLKPRSPKFPIVARKNADGKIYKLPERSIESLTS